MLKFLLYPQSLAVIGASRTQGKVGYEILFNLLASKFQGPLIPINPTATEILGLKCYPNLSTYGQAVDLAVIAVANSHVKSAVEDCLKIGVKSICIITAGFKEVNSDGARLEQEIAQMCRKQGVPLVGPNCLGLLNTDNNMNASFAKRMPCKGNISVISQSGALCTAILDAAASRHLGLGKLVSMGNKADLTENDFLRYLSTDNETKVIVGYLESIVSGNAFIKVAEAAATCKPVVVFKAGVTQAGVKAASSHTGGLAGADMAYGAAFQRGGVIRAKTFEELFDYATAFAMQPLPKGNRVAIITNAGGPGIMAADAVEQSGLKVESPGSSLINSLKGKLPAAASLANPIDVLGDADPERYAMAVNAAQDDENIDAIIVILTPQAMTLPAETARAISACSKGEKTILVSFMGGEDVMKGREELIAANLPDYPSPERAVAALKAMYDYFLWLKRPPRILTRFPVNRNRASRIITRQLKISQMQVGEASAKAILKAYGFNIPPGGSAGSVDEAVEIAIRVGLPVAMKISSQDIIHKSDLGGVKLNLASPEAVRDAFDLMMMRIKSRAPDARIDGVYVERMCQGGTEVILGMTRDPQFGPMLMFGLGGIFVEVMKDVTFHLAPITAQEAMQMLESTKSFSLLKGYRGQAGVDLYSIASSLQRISQLVTDFPQIVEMDINPFIVGQTAADSIAADARITLSEAMTNHE